MFDFIIQLAETLWKYGATPTALGMALFAVLRTKAFKNKMKRYMPFLFAGDGEINKAYVTNQARIESKLDAIMHKEGIEWNGPEGIKTVTAMSSKQPLISYWGVKRMKNKLKSRKFWVAIIGALLVIANETFDLGLSAESQATIVAILISFILGESHVDAKRAGKETKNDDDFETTIEPRV